MGQDFSIALSYDDVLLVPQRSKISSRSEVDLSTTLTPKLKLKIPIVTANMSDITGVEMAVAIGKLGGLGVLPRFMSEHEQAEMVENTKKAGLVVAAAIGIRNGMFKRADTLVKAGASVLFIDVAHGHMQKAINATSTIRKRFGNEVDIVSGNVATRKAAEDLFKAGADCVKVGVGPGSICTTRIETGSGVPQITAILEAAKSAKKFKKTLLADGGTKNSGDIVKGLAAGASAIMTGSQVAGTEEAPGKKIKVKGKIFKRYNASTSLAEKTKHIKDNGHEFNKNYIKQIEGVESLVPYKGKLKDVIDKMSANIRSGFSYSGAKNIEDLWKKRKFVRITGQGMRESRAHDVMVVDN